MSAIPFVFPSVQTVQFSTIIKIKMPEDRILEAGTPTLKFCVISLSFFFTDITTSRNFNFRFNYDTRWAEGFTRVKFILVMNYKYARKSACKSSRFKNYRIRKSRILKLHYSPFG